jgi:uncharacterized protein YoxC
MNKTTIKYLAGLVCALVLIAGIFVASQLHSMSANLDRMSARMDSLTRMDEKLTITNKLLTQTNASLSKMLAESVSANDKLGHMRADLATMSHKISGSFLFRGVK